MVVIDRASEIKNKFRSYSIYLNGKKIGKIRNGERIEYNTLSGDHQLSAKIDWVKSDVFTTNLAENDKLHLEISTASDWKPMYALLSCGVLAGLGAMLFGLFGAGLGGGLGGLIYGSFACKPQLNKKKNL